MHEPAFLIGVRACSISESHQPAEPCRPIKSRCEPKACERDFKDGRSAKRGMMAERTVIE